MIRVQETGVMRVGKEAGTSALMWTPKKGRPYMTNTFDKNATAFKMLIVGGILPLFDASRVACGEEESALMLSKQEQ